MADNNNPGGTTPRTTTSIPTTSTAKAASVTASAAAASAAAAHKYEEYNEEEMNIALSQIPNRDVYEKAKSKCPDLILSESNPRWFWQYTYYANANAAKQQQQQQRGGDSCGPSSTPAPVVTVAAADVAAQRLVAYWNLRHQTFGSERCYRSLMDLSENDNGALDVTTLRCINVGTVFLLPPDIGQRMVLFIQYTNVQRFNEKHNVTMERKCKIIFFWFNVLAMHDTSRTVGFTYLRLFLEKGHRVSPNLLQFMCHALMNCFPMILMKHHVIIAPRIAPKKTAVEKEEREISYMRKLYEKYFGFTSNRAIDLVGSPDGTRKCTKLSSATTAGSRSSRRRSNNNRKTSLAAILTGPCGLRGDCLPDCAGGRWTYQMCKSAILANEMEPYTTVPSVPPPAAVAAVRMTTTSSADDEGTTTTTTALPSVAAVASSNKDDNNEKNGDYHDDSSKKSNGKPMAAAAAAAVARTTPDIPRRGRRKNDDDYRLYEEAPRPQVLLMPPPVAEQPPQPNNNNATTTSALDILAAAAVWKQTDEQTDSKEEEE